MFLFIAVRPSSLDVRRSSILAYESLQVPTMIILDECNNFGCLEMNHTARQNDATLQVFVGLLSMFAL